MNHTIRNATQSFSRPATFPLFLVFLLILLTQRCGPTDPPTILEVQDNARIVLVGNNLGSRMMNFGHFETEMQMRYPDQQLFIRNMCDGGNTPGFRPHPGRETPWAFPGADTFQVELATPSGSQGHFEYPDEWLTRLGADVILAFFGYNESFQGEAGLENFKGELNAFVKHTLAQRYNDSSAPQLALVSPIAFEDLSDKMDLPDGVQENQNLALYTQAIEEVAAANQVHFVDVFTPTQKWFAPKTSAYTQDGFQLTDDGYKRLAPLLADKTFGKMKAVATQFEEGIHAAVMEKKLDVAQRL